MNRSAYRSVPNWFGTCWVAIASTAALIELVDMLGSKIFTFGPKSTDGAAVAAPEIASAATATASATETRRTDEAIWSPSLLTAGGLLERMPARAARGSNVHPHDEAKAAAGRRRPRDCRSHGRRLDREAPRG